MPPRPESLVERLARAARDRPVRAAGVRWVPCAVAGLLAAGPLLTIGGAKLFGAQERRASDALRAEVAPRIAAREAAAASRAVLAPVLARPALGTTLEAIARALPAEAVLVRAERKPAGGLEFDIAAPDPDTLRARLRRTRDFARLRDAGQRQDGGVLVTSLREAGQ